MTNNILTIPFSQRDPQEVLAYAKSRLTEISLGAWTDFLDSDPGYALLKTVVGLLCQNQYYTDQQLAECFIHLAKSREGVIRGAKQLNYLPTLVEAATCEAQISIPSPYNEQIEIDRYSLWSINKLSFLCLDPIVIPEGSVHVNVDLVQGTLFSQDYTSTGASWYEIVIPKNVAALTVTVDNVTWAPVDTFIGIINRKSYKLCENVSGQSILFEAGINADKPITGQTIRVRGVLTKGSAGNIEAPGFTLKPLSTIRDLENNNITNLFTGITTTGALGGKDAEDIDMIRVNAPAFYSTQGRCVTADDYKAFLMQFPELREFKVTGGQEVGRYGDVIITIIGEDPYGVSNDLKNFVREKLASKNMLTVTVVVQSPTVVEITQVYSISVLKSSGLTLSGARNLVINSLSAANDARKIGASVYESDSLSLIKGTPGIDHGSVVSTVNTFVTSQAGVVVCPIIGNADLTECVLTKQDGTVLFSGNGTSKVSKGFFTHTVEGMPDQRVNLRHKPLTDDILIKHDQIGLLSSLEINAEYSS